MGKKTKGHVRVRVAQCQCVRDRAHPCALVHMCEEDRGAEIEWSCLMTGTADSFRESSER